MESLSSLHFSPCLLGDWRLSRRALMIGTALSKGFGKALSQVFERANDLKRAYEFFANPKVTFEKLVEPHQRLTATTVASEAVILAVGDTTYLDYAPIKVKRNGYGPFGKGGNGLLLHSSLAVEAQGGQPVGVLWQKLWHRDPKPEGPNEATLAQRKKRQTQKRTTAHQKPFEQKESYRWVEALQVVDQRLPVSTRIIHVFDREGDISEVFEQVSQLENTGVVVRAAHDRCLEATPLHLWQKMDAEPIQFQQEIELAKTDQRSARQAKVAVRFCRVSLPRPYRFKLRESLQVYAVYAQEIDCPEGEEPISWMLLTTEPVTDVHTAATILRWYSYRWRVEDYHKILKSGCQVERYRLAAENIAGLLAFLCVIAVELLRLTFLHRTQPDTPIEIVLRPVQIEVLKAKTAQVSELNVDWGIRSIAQLGGYLEHRRNTPIGIQVLWRGWLKLETLCEGWQLAHSKP